MKKVGIITFHNALNYGATLQAYALCRFLNDNGYEAEVLNYVNPKMQKEIKVWYPFLHLSRPVDRLYGLMKIPLRIRQKHMFDRFINERMNISGPIVSSANSLNAFLDMYDVFIAGSDQVFNFNGTGEDYNFFLQFVPDNKVKIAYAPSFGMKDIDEKHKDIIAGLLGHFNALSVRERDGATIVQNLLGFSPEIVADPTFLLTDSQWKSFAEMPDISTPYVLVYSFGSTHLEQLALEKAKQIHGIVINVNRSMPSANRQITRCVAPTPEQFVGLIYGAEYVVTNSFHGMALSLNLNKQFSLFLNTYSKAENTNPRFYSLAEMFEITNHIRNFDHGLSPDVVPYDIVNEHINSLREKSYHFLKKAIDD